MKSVVTIIMRLNYPIIYNRKKDNTMNELKEIQLKTIEELRLYHEKTSEFISQIKPKTKEIMKALENDDELESKIKDKILANYDNGFLGLLVNKLLVSQNLSLKTFSTALSEEITLKYRKDKHKFFFPKCFFSEEYPINMGLFKVDFWELPSIYTYKNKAIIIEDKSYFISLHIQHLSFFVQKFSRKNFLKTGDYDNESSLYNQVINLYLD